VPTTNQCILAVTEGQVGNENAITKAARAAGCLVHLIGMGLAPNDAIRSIAEVSGGRAVFLAPDEDIPSAIERFASVLIAPTLLAPTLPKGWKTATDLPILDILDGLGEFTASPNDSLDLNELQCRHFTSQIGMFFFLLSSDFVRSETFPLD